MSRWNIRFSFFIKRNNIWNDLHHMFSPLVWERLNVQRVAKSSRPLNLGTKGFTFLLKHASGQIEYFFKIESFIIDRIFF